MLRVEHEDRTKITYAEHFTVVVVYEGAFDGWYRGGVRTHVAGSLKLKEPGEVHRDLRVHAPFTLQGAGFAPELVAAAADAMGLRGAVALQGARLRPGRARHPARVRHARRARPRGRHRDRARHAGRRDAERDRRHEPSFERAGAAGRAPGARLPARRARRQDHARRPRRARGARQVPPGARLPRRGRAAALRVPDPPAGLSRAGSCSGAACSSPRPRRPSASTTRASSTGTSGASSASRRASTPGASSAPERTRPTSPKASGRRRRILAA